MAHETELEEKIQEVNDEAEMEQVSGRMEYDEYDAILQHICECSSYLILSCV
jgi:hypothetical protein